ncbi:L,D-transpeptidase family protein [Acetobacter okinawensis]|uniref:L,D-transpeptidase family protein n=1 Tax=Acetobacter okinawensis TaxID=1076594 RepID=UPI001BABFCE7|nr:L,D-transpeptidase family protein [Acetobacter okinawensis]MBS0964631.1 L,D-transpeptidase family protein [Acetobacter okinawensis]MBS0988084.1 L,D-transpeptidase family protein [Acetobacter okinawensis]
MIIHVWPASDSHSDAKLHCGQTIMSAVIGKNGVTSRKREGDMCTPVGHFTLRKVYYRADRVEPPQTRLPLAPITPQDGWCDDPGSELYNHFLIHPHPARHEMLWREDAVYNIVVVIGYNDSPAVPGKGSAIFMHLQRRDLTPTEGCVALSENDLLEVLASGATAITIHAAADTPG